MPQLNNISNVDFNSKKFNFFSTRKVILEVGFGMGDNLKHMIDKDKNAFFIGIKVYQSHDSCSENILFFL